MRCEVVAVGTELLLGQIVDTNSSWIGEQLALVGIDSHFQVKVGDNAGRMEFCIRQALERSDAVVCCGGLGPTQDDITRDVIAQIMGVEMVRDDTIAAHIRDIFEGRGRVMPENNLRQADVPEGASTIAQMPGTAPGLVCPLTIDGVEKVIYAVPGVPHEMREMMLGTVLDDLRQRGLAEPRRAEKQHMVHRLAAALGSLDEHAQILARCLLPDEFGKALGSQRGIGVFCLALGGVDGDGFGHTTSLPSC